MAPWVDTYGHSLVTGVSLVFRGQWINMSVVTLKLLWEEIKTQWPGLSDTVGSYSNLSEGLYQTGNAWLLFLHLILLTGIAK